MRWFRARFDFDSRAKIPIRRILCTGIFFAAGNPEPGSIPESPRRRADLIPARSRLHLSVGLGTPYPQQVAGELLIRPQPTARVRETSPRPPDVHIFRTAAGIDPRLVV